MATAHDSFTPGATHKCPAVPAEWSLVFHAADDSGSVESSRFPVDGWYLHAADRAVRVGFCPWCSMRMQVKPLRFALDLPPVGRAALDRMLALLEADPVPARETIKVLLSTVRLLSLYVQHLDPCEVDELENQRAGSRVKPCTCGLNVILAHEL